MAARSSRKASTRTTKSKGRRTRKYKTKKGIDRQISSITAPTRKRRRRHRKSTAVAKLKAKKSRIRTKKRMTAKDRMVDRKRGKVLRKRRATKRGKTVSVSKRSGRSKHKFSLSSLNPFKRKTALQKAVKALKGAGSAIKRRMKKTGSSVKRSLTRATRRLSRGVRRAAIRARVVKPTRMEKFTAGVRKHKGKIAVGVGGTGVAAGGAYAYNRKKRRSQA